MSIPAKVKPELTIGRAQLIVWIDKIQGALTAGAEYGTIAEAFRVVAEIADDYQESETLIRRVELGID